LGILPLLIEVAKHGVIAIRVFHEHGVIAIRVFHKHGVLHFVSYLWFKPCWLYTLGLDLLWWLIIFECTSNVNIAICLCAPNAIH
jgi:hypothetical protein